MTLAEQINKLSRDPTYQDRLAKKNINELEFIATFYGGMIRKKYSLKFHSDWFYTGDFWNTKTTKSLSIVSHSVARISAYEHNSNLVKMSLSEDFRKYILPNITISYSTLIEFMNKLYQHFTGVIHLAWSNTPKRCEVDRVVQVLVNRGKIKRPKYRWLRDQNIVDMLTGTEETFLLACSILRQKKILT